MANGLGNSGQSNGQLSPFRWDPAVALGLLVMVAMVVVIGLHFSVHGSVGASAGIHR